MLKIDRTATQKYPKKNSDHKKCFRFVTSENNKK